MKDSSNILFWGFLGVRLFLLFKKNKQSEGVGKIEDIISQAQTKAMSIKDAVPVLINSERDIDVNNGDIVGCGDGFTLSEALQEKSGLPEFINTKTQLRRALSCSRKDERAILVIKRDNAPRGILTKKQILEKALDLTSCSAWGVDCRTERDGYIMALCYIAAGGKVRWNDKFSDAVVHDKTTRTDYGLCSSLFTTGLGDRNYWRRRDKRTRASSGERKAYARIIDNKEGTPTPGHLAEMWRCYDADTDDKEILNGILDAYSEVCSPQEALSKLKHIIEKNEYDELSAAGYTPEEEEVCPF